MAFSGGVARDRPIARRETVRSMGMKDRSQLSRFHHFLSATPRWLAIDLDVESGLLLQRMALLSAAEEW
jgi:hypothetical protein